MHRVATRQATLRPAKQACRVGTTPSRTECGDSVFQMTLQVVIAEASSIIKLRRLASKWFHHFNNDFELLSASGKVAGTAV